MKTYKQVIDNLTISLNGAKNTNNILLFTQSIKDLKYNYKKSVSTRFLKDLIKLQTKRQKTKRINYLLKKCNLKTKRTLRDDFKEWVLNKFKTDIIEYAINKEGQVYIKDIRNQDVGKLAYQDGTEVLHTIII